MPIPPTLTSYLPVLLCSVSNAAVPDDSSFQTLPQGQVDYLSHEWREEDVWQSWRSMTRQKNAIANGMRLENASWRTWWKQRNKLKTISPETLNWLKDSDVTWLYGPLHIGCDWSTEDEKRSDLALKRKSSFDSVPSKRKSNAAARKPILKHRSISELLSLPASPFFGQEELEDEYGLAQSPEGADEDGDAKSRPQLLHTKSDSHISWRSRPFRKDSPPRIIASELPQGEAQGTSIMSSDASNSTGTGSDQDLSTCSSGGLEATNGDVAGVGGKKKHISFNTFVEQCIAIEKPDSNGRRRAHDKPRLYESAEYDDGYDEDSEVGYEDDSDEPSSFYIEDHDDNSDSDDDVLEMRTASSRSRSSSSSRSRHSPFSSAQATASPRVRPSLLRAGSIDRERVSIAPIAPTILKTTGVGNNLATVGEGHVTPVPKDVQLVYVPPSNGIYSIPGTPNVGSEGVYHHRESYFSVGAPNSDSRSPSTQTSPLIASVGMPSEASKRNIQRILGPGALTDPPQHTGDIAVEDAYDYFGGPDLGEDLSTRSQHSVKRIRSPDDRNDSEDRQRSRMLRYAQGGAASVTTGRSSGDPDWSSPDASPKMPVVVVNEVAGATEERDERSRSNSPLEGSTFVDIQGCAEELYPLGSSSSVPVPAVGDSHPRVSSPAAGSDSSYLSPPTRGRSPHCSSVSGSTTTGSYSCSSDSRSESRGRSASRSSPFSDRSRSNSRSSRGTNSPLGSVSPTGSLIGISGTGPGRGRDREIRGRMVRMGSDDGERGRKVCGSKSPPSVVGSPGRRGDGSDCKQSSPRMSTAGLDGQLAVPSPPSSVSGSSTASSSATISPPPKPELEPVPNTRPRIRLETSSTTPPIPEKPSPKPRHPTPSNSPTLTFRPVSSMPHPASVLPPPQSPSAAPLTPPRPRLSGPETSPSEAKATTSPPTSPTLQVLDRTARGSMDGHENGGQGGTLAGRAADLMSSARGFLGAFWSASPTPAQ